MAQRNSFPGSSSGPTLRLHSLAEGPPSPGTLRTVGLDGPGPRFARLRGLTATQLQIQSSRGGHLPATGLTWSLSREGLALTLLMGN